ncbi:MAG: hypothetical protein ACK4GN_07580 [Runella sp.]
MFHKFNTTALNEYCQRFAGKVCDEFYTQNTIASGQHILNLTAIPQVNLFVISKLYEKWKAEAEAFRSPYFNFESSEVKEAMLHFMNIVSRHIAVKREHLEPLVAESTKETLTLLLDPSGYFNEIFRNQADFTVTASTIQQIVKYLKFNKFVPQAIARQMGDRNFVYVNQAIEWSEKVIQQQAGELEDATHWIMVFAEKLPLSVEDLLKKIARPEPTKVAEPTPNQSFFDSLSEEPLPEIKPKVTPPQEVEAVYAVPKTPRPPQNLNETVGANGNANKESLNDSLRSEKATVSDAYQKQAISSISQHIPLHQKFMFIHQLFGGSNSAYETAIAELEQSPDFNAARALITYKYASQYLWDMTSDTVGELLEVVKRRFGQ